MSAETFRILTQLDAQDLSAFLTRHFETSMFLRSNLDAHGLEGSDHPHAMTCFGRFEAKRGLTGVFAVTNGGYLLVQAPEEPAALANAALQDPHMQQRLRDVSGMTGEAVQVGAVLSVLGITSEMCSLHQDEPLMTRDLKVPLRANARLRRPEPKDAPLLTEWLRDYMLSTGWVMGEIDKILPPRVESSLTDPHFRIMVEEGTPVGMTTLNARAGEDVQIGGVYVPPNHRSRGYAERMVARQLQEMAEQGATRAILFANSPVAERVYGRIGFETCGAYRVALLERPWSLPDVARPEDTA